MSRKKQQYHQQQQQQQQLYQLSSLLKNKRKKGTGIWQKNSNARVKARNFLTNISNSRLNKQDRNNRTFICDTYVLLAQNTNLFLLERKF